MRKKFLRTLIAGLLVCSLLSGPVAFAEDATVTGADVNLRSGPGTNYRVVACLSEGTTVNVTDRSNPDWYAVTYNGTSGYMSSRYLRIQEAAPAAPATQTGTPGHITGMYVRFRSGPGSGASILGEYNNGKAVTITGSENGWTACIIDGRAGYVYSAYVAEDGEPAAAVIAVQQPQNTPEPTPIPTQTPAEQEPQEVVAVIVVSEAESEEPPAPVETPKPTEAPRPVASPKPTEAPKPVENPKPTETPKPTEAQEVVAVERPGKTDPQPTATPKPAETPQVNATEEKTGAIQGTYVCFRSGPGTTYSILSVYNTGKELTITGTSGAWTACTIDGRSGFVYSQYVAEKQAASEPASNEEPDAVEPVSPAESVSGEEGYITGNNVRLRSGASMSSEILGELFYGNTVTITGTSGDWTAVNYQGKSGYVYSRYVSGGSYKPSETPQIPSDGKVTGQQIVDFALQFEGYRYTWGGASPSTGFDCSGLVYYVYGQFGYTMNRVAADQALNGVHVDPSDLQPGDVLCFYSGGGYIGHAGIYIGNNRFIHAANSYTGVVVAELSGYYESRGFEARRILN